MKPIYCPVCGADMDMDKGCLMCTHAERTLRKSTTEWIFQSLKNVRQVPPIDISENKNNDYFCPNCRSPLREYDKNQRYYECSNCNLNLRAMSHFDFEDLERIHKIDPLDNE